MTSRITKILVLLVNKSGKYEKTTSCNGNAYKAILSIVVDISSKITAKNNGNEE